MKLSDISVKRPVFASVLAILIAMVGIVGFLSLSVREYPDVDPPIVSVQTSYIGAAASVVESRITQPLEDRLAGVEGLQTITSRSRDGQSDITVEFAPGRSVDTAANDVRDRVGGAAQDLPEEALAPRSARSTRTQRRSSSLSSPSPAGRAFSSATMSIAPWLIGSRRSTASPRCSSSARRGRRCASGCSPSGSRPSA